MISTAIVASALVLTLAPTASAQAAESCVTVDETVTCTFAFTGQAETWVAPPGVVLVSADLQGAEGGSIATFTRGGYGGRATAPLVVAPGTPLTLSVGGTGDDVNFCDNSTVPAAGGFNGGGAGGGSALPCRGAGGGGATDIRLGGTALTDRVLIAGGGGGSANGLSANGPFFGGAGGGLEGLRGGPTGQGGAPGDQAGGGSGQLGQGSDGTPTGGVTSGSGGGGGGYYGGASGTVVGFGTSYGGGGGSGFGPADAVFETGVRQGDGMARLAFPAVFLSAQTASSVTHDSARLTVTVDPNGRVDLPVRILYGTDADALTSFIELDPVTGQDPVARTQTISGLLPATTYVFRTEVPGDPTTPALDVSTFTTASVPVPAGPDPEPGTGGTPGTGVDDGSAPPPASGAAAAPVRSLANTGGSTSPSWSLAALAAIALGTAFVAGGRRMSRAARTKDAG